MNVRDAFFYRVGSAPFRQALDRALRVLKGGGLVIFPTETVYGLACDPKKRGACRKILRSKGRSRQKRLTLQVDTCEKALKLVRPDPRFERLAKFFWPGPLTVVAKARRGNQKVGVRIPRHPVALKVLKAYGSCLAVTSANLSGGPPLSKREDLLRVFGSKVGVIFWEPQRKKEASTVVEVTGKTPVLLRKGPISMEKILRVAS